MDSLVLNRIQQDLTLRPLAAIDAVLDECARVAKTANPGLRQELFQLFSRAILAHTGASCSRTGKPAPTDLFDHGLLLEHGRFIAVCLLRLLSADEAYFSDLGFRAKAVNLFDEQLADVYAALKLQSRQQTYEKVAALKSVPADAEKEVVQLIAALGGLQDLQSFRNELTRRLRSKFGPTVFSPFLPPQVVEARLGGIFTALEQYRDATGLAKATAYTATRRVLEQISKDALDYGTHYGRVLLADSLQRLLQLLETDFRSSPLSKPAWLAIRASAKKYPLSNPGSDLRIQLILTNEGAGPSFDTRIRLHEATDMNMSRPEIFLGEVAPGTMDVPLGGRLQSETTSVILAGEVS